MASQNFSMVHSLCTHGQSNSWRIGKIADHFKFLTLHSACYANETMCPEGRESVYSHSIREALSASKLMLLSSSARKLLYSCTGGMCHSSTRPGTSYHVTQFYQVFPRISTASDKCWGEKTWVRCWTYCTKLGPSIAFAKCVVCTATVILARLYYYHSLSFLVSKSNLFVWVAAGTANKNSNDARMILIDHILDLLLPSSL